MGVVSERAPGTGASPPTGERAAGPRTEEFPWFDSLRGIAALGVFTFHVGAYAELVDYGTVSMRWIGRLDVSLPMFFVISAFLLWRPFVAARARGKPALRTGAYAIRRLLRVVPGYWFILAVVALVLPSAEVWEDPLVYFGFAQDYSQTTIGGGIPQAWSLGVELTYYALLPLLAWILRRFTARTTRSWLLPELAMLAVLFAGSVVWKVVVLSDRESSPSIAPVTELATLPTYLDQFALGMLIAVLSVWVADRGKLPRWLAPLDRWPSLAWGGALALWIFAAAGIGLTGAAPQTLTDSQWLLRHELFGLVGALFILPAVFGDQRRGLTRRYVLSNRFLLYIGLISYSFYLWHVFVTTEMSYWGWEDRFGFLPPTVRWLLPAFVATVALSTLTFYLVERPGMNLRRRLGRDPGRKGSYESARRAQERLLGSEASGAEQGPRPTPPPRSD